MAEVINTNVFDATKKFVDFAGLDYFWEKAKAYVDGVDTAMDGRVSALETTVGNANSGLVKDVRAIQDELNSLSGGAGSIATQIENALGTLDVADAAVAGQYVSSVSETDGKITVTRADLPVYEEVGVAKDFNDAMDARVKVLEAIDHDKLAADASAAAVATVLDGAPEKFDTLKEIAQWISDSETADSAADLVTRVSTLETTVGDAESGLVKDIADLKAVDATNLQAAKDYADGLKTTIDGVIEENERVTSESLTDLNTRVETLEGKDAYVKVDVDKQISDAQAAAIAQAKLDAAAALADYYKKTETYSKTEVDTLLSTNSTGDRAYAKQYTDELFQSITFASNSDIDALFV